MSDKNPFGEGPVESDEEYGERLREACRLLPAWFVPRMIDDVWSFGLMMSTGVVIAVENITAVTQAANGDIWIDVTLQTAPGVSRDDAFTAPTSRATASINAQHIVAAYELADT